MGGQPRFAFLDSRKQKKAGFEGGANTTATTATTTQGDYELEDGDTLWLLNGQEEYQGPTADHYTAEDAAEARVTVLDGTDVWVDPEAIEQVKRIVRASPLTVERAVGLPDLHQGPTGVAILATVPMPKLPGYDIGCGMSLFPTRIPSNIARDRVARCMARLDLDNGEALSLSLSCVRLVRESLNPEPSIFPVHAGDFPIDPHFGTIGGGNHFAELQTIDPEVPLSEAVAGLLDPSRAVLLVHSGSRGHGQRVFATHSDGHDPEGYMKEHEELVHWAKRNRAEIARRFLRQFAACSAAEEQEQEPAEAGPAGAAPEAVSYLDQAPEAVIDIAHNWIQRLPDGKFLHRKGAAPSHEGSLSLLPGSRATASYVLVCNGTHDRDLNSVAHGAGRRLSRADARRKVTADGSGSAGGGGDLTRGSTVVCKCKNLLLEEAPQAYKDVEAVVQCMVGRGMCSVGARMLPIATYKTRSSSHSA
jgi:release factor H-coupled RctB family protein